MGETSRESVDPDAPWRRGFDGWDESAADGVATPDSAPPLTRPAAASDPGDERAPSQREAPNKTIGAIGSRVGTLARPRRAIGLLIVTVLAVGAIGVALLRPTGDAGSVPQAPVLPAALDGLWSHSFERGVDDVAVADDLVVVASRGELTAFDLEGGTRRWRRIATSGTTPLEDQIAVIDGVVVVLTSASGSVAGVDRLTGDELWRHDDSDGSYSLFDPDGEPLLLRRRRVADVNVVEVIDPDDGVPVGDAMPLSSVSAAGRNLGVQPADRRVAIWSLDRRVQTAGPVGSFGLRAVAEIGGLVVALDLDGRIAIFDDTGVRTDEELLAPAATDASSIRSDLAGVAPPVVVVAVDDASLGFTVDDGDLVLAWQRSGRLGAPVSTDRGAVSLLVEPTGSGLRLDVVDVGEGTSVLAPDPGRELLPLLGRNGVLLAPALGGPDRLLEAVDYDGRPMWSLPIADGAGYELLDGAVVVVEPTPAGTVLTVAR